MATTQVGDDDFGSAVLGSDKPVLVDFWAEWCGPCKMIGPSLEEISEELGDQTEHRRSSRHARQIWRSRYPDDDPVQGRPGGRNQGRRSAQGRDQKLA
jgi:thiol-disulfide isomerase/thioredoxin